jgi:hypothetical protein
VLGVLLLQTLWTVTPQPVQAETTRAQQRRFNAAIVDYRQYVNRRFPKVPRKATQYIIVHTAEAGLTNTLRVVTQGKRLRGGRRTYGGHAHYVIGRDGKTYRTLDKRYRADHAGKSMWNRQTNLSNVSIGIELVGYHHSTITNAQYRSLELLLDILQRIYRLEDTDVLTHSQVAYGGPNPWFRRDHRGRKRCAQNFNRAAAGLTSGWTYDPDVKAGRLLPDRELATILYTPKPAPRRSSNAHVITASRSAWMIAGEKYNDATTLYRLPSGAVVAGDRMGARVGWRRVPPGTVVTLDTPIATAGGDRVIKNGNTPWGLAGTAYKRKTTHYLFPNGVIKNGQQISNWAGIPDHTQVFVGYQGPYRITSSRPPIVIAGNRYRDRDTLYVFPDRRILSGAEIKNWKRLPRGVRMLVPADKS